MAEIYVYNSKRSNHLRKLGFLHFNFDDLVCKIHIHREIEIVIVTEGVLTVQIGNRHYDVTAGSAVFINSYDPHSYSSPQSSKCILIEFTDKMYPAFYDWLMRYHTDEKLAVIPPEYLSAVLAALKDVAPLRNHEIEPLQAQAILAPLCYIFMKNCCWNDISRRHNDLFLDALEIVINSPIKTITRSSVAKQLGVSPETLSRKFQKCSDLSFINYVQHFRINKALDALEKGVKISQAAQEAGFGDIRNFNRVFKEIMGCTPSEYLKKAVILEM